MLLKIDTKFKFISTMLFTLLTFAAPVSADIVLDNWDINDLTDSDGDGSWSVELNNMNSASNVQLSDVLTGETLNFDFAGTINGIVSSTSVFEDSNGGDRLGLNDTSDDGSLDPDDNNDFDRNQGMLITFNTDGIIRDVNLDGMNEFERAFIFINGVHTYSLLDNSDMGSYTGGINSAGGDDFVNLNWMFEAGDTVELRMNGTVGDENGWKIDTVVFSVPEPTGLLPLGLLSLVTLRRRRTTK